MGRLRGGPSRTGAEGAYLDRYVTDEQRSSRPIFNATLRAAAKLKGFRRRHTRDETAVNENREVAFAGNLGIDNEGEHDWNPGLSQVRRRRKNNVAKDKVTTAIEAMGQIFSNTTSAGIFFKKIPLTITMM
jgi:hypothetical protein